MVRSSRGPRQATTWAAEHTPRLLARIVRLGRPANDNARQIGPRTITLYASLTAAVVLFALLHWQAI